MGVSFDLNYAKDLFAQADSARAHEFLSDVELSFGKSFPELESFTKVGPDTYEWRFPNFAYGGFSFQPIVWSRFEKSAEGLILHPCPGKGNIQVSGGWQVRGSPKEAPGCTLHFQIRLSAELPIPFFLKSVVTPAVQREMTPFFDRYLQNVQTALQ